MKKLILTFSVMLLAVFGAVTSALAKGSSNPPPAAPIQPAVTPCWFQMPGLLHLVNLNAVASVYVTEDKTFGGDVRYTVTVRSSSNNTVAATTLARKDAAEQLLQSIRNASAECR